MECVYVGVLCSERLSGYGKGWLRAGYDNERWIPCIANVMDNGKFEFYLELLDWGGIV